MPLLHPTAERVLQAIYEYQQENDNWYPTVRDLQDATGISSTSVVSLHLSRLKNRNYIDVRKNRVACRITAEGLIYLKANNLLPRDSEMPAQESTEERLLGLEPA
jgi:Mn-dependent DtxR family transcriptional regulator